MSATNLPSGFIMGIYVFLPILAGSVSLLLAARRLVHFFQLESYQFQGYFKTLRRQRALIDCLMLAVFYFGSSVVAYLLYAVFGDLLLKRNHTWLFIVIAMIYSVLCVFIGYF